MIAFLIIGVICLLLCYPAMKVLEREGSRWSNLVLALLLMIGIICVGIWACI